MLTNDHSSSFFFFFFSRGKLGGKCEVYVRVKSLQRATTYFTISTGNMQQFYPSFPWLTVIIINLSLVGKYSIFLIYFLNGPTLKWTSFSRVSFNHSIVNYLINKKAVVMIHYWTSWKIFKAPLLPISNIIKYFNLNSNFLKKLRNFEPSWGEGLKLERQL